MKGLKKMKIFKGLMNAFLIVFIGVTVSIALNVVNHFFGIVPLIVLVILLIIALVVECSID